MLQWKTISECKKYSVSNSGLVKNNKTGKTLKPYDNGNGYQKVTLCDNGKVKRLFVHRLVAMAFVEGYKEGLTVDHINAKRDDNNYKNLQWMTLEENVKKAHMMNA